MDETSPVDPGLPGHGNPLFGGPPKNDIKVDAPEPSLSLENAISNNAHVTLHFQGAFPVRAGSHVPDPETLSGWVADLRELSGYPLVRFRVTFDLSRDLATYPLNAQSLRPAVDYVRLRANY